MALPLQQLADFLAGLVDLVSSWPGSTLQFPQPPSIYWLVDAFGLVIALLAGLFVRRLAACLLCTMLCVGWLLMSTHHATPLFRYLRMDHGPSLHVNMFAVGGGSCYLLRVGPGLFGKGGTRPHTIMFDCGSKQYLSVGLNTIVPALRHLGVNRIDILVLSHADINHFFGSLDVLDYVSVGRVLVSEYFSQGASRRPESAADCLIDQINAHGVPV